MAYHLQAATRRGNALVLGLGVILLAATMIIASTENFVARQKTSSSGVNQTVAVSALDAVLSRRSKSVVDLASSGDPAAFAAFTKNFGADIVGACEVRWKIEPVRTPYINGETNSIPFITNPSPELSWSPPTSIDDGHGNALNWQTNDYIYLYRIAAESRVISEGASRPLARAQGVRYVAINNQPLFRWVIFYAAEGPKGDLELSHGTDLSVLGNVHSNGSIFLGSSPTTNNWLALKPALGTTAIGPTSTSWTAWSSGASYDISNRVERGGNKYKCTASHIASGSSEPGSGTGWQAYWELVSKARVTGADGVFRLSKPTIFGAFNGFPMTGTAPSGFAVNSSCYSLTSTWCLGEPQGGSATGSHYGSPDTSSVAAATYGGAMINPNRVRDASGLQTQAYSGSDTGVQINGIAIRGVVDGVLPANDSRDIDRSSTTKWANTYALSAPNGFEATVRQSATGGKVVSLPRMLQGRTLEAQKVEYPTSAWADGATYVSSFPAPSDATYTSYDPTAANVVQHRARWYACKSSHAAGTSSEPGVGSSWTTYWSELEGEPHEYARPMFLQPNGTVTTHLIPGSTETYAGIEVPGKYLSNALGSTDYYMKRKLSTLTDQLGQFIGWTVVNSSGAAVSTQPAQVGLIIRERPVPDKQIFASTSAAPLSASWSIPYAYGKHNRPVIWPFTIADVSSESVIGQSINLGTPSGSDAYASDVNLTQVPVNLVNTDSSYLRNQAYIHIKESAASQSYSSGGSITMRAAANPGPNFPKGWYDSISGMFRQPHYYAENWRLMQLAQNKAPEESAGLTGLTTYFFNDAYYDTQSPTPGWRWLGPFGGVPVGPTTTFTSSATFTSTTPPANGVGNYMFSIRWQGFIRPTTTATYQFRTSCTWGARVWVGEQRVVDAWVYPTSTSTTYSLPSDTELTSVSLTANQNYPITIEWYCRDSSTKTFSLLWKTSSGAFATVPGSVLRPALNDTATRQVNALNWSDFKAAQFKIDRLTGNALQKVGLMIRGGAGLPKLLDGRDPYAALLYSPTRGFFLQERGVRSLTGKAIGTSFFAGLVKKDGVIQTSSTGQMSSEDSNLNGVLNTTPTNEDISGDGLLQDPATEKRLATLIPLGPVDGAVGAVTTGTYVNTYYMPSSAGAAAWSTNLGSGTTDGRYLAMSTIANPPFAISEGTVDKVYTGPMTLQSYKISYARKSQTITRAWYYVLDPKSLYDPDTSTDYSSAARFISTSGIVPTDYNKTIKLYQRSEPGTSTVATGWGGIATQNSSLTNSPDLGNPGLHDSWTATAFLNGNITGFGPTTISYASPYTTGLSRSWPQTNYYPTDSSYLASSPSATVTKTVSANTFFYLTTPDTRPKVYQGSTYVRTLTQAETKAYMEATYGGTWTACTSLSDSTVTYPTATQPAYPTVSSDPVTPTLPAGYAEVAALRTQVTLATTTTFNVNHAWEFRAGEYYLIDSEWIKVTAATAVATNFNNPAITVLRGQFGSTAAPHAAGAIFITPTPATTTGAISTTTQTVIALDSVAAIKVDDILRLNKTTTTFELVKVTAVDTSASTVTVTRGILTTPQTFASGLRIVRPQTRTFTTNRSSYYTFDLNSYTSAYGNTAPDSSNTGWFYKPSTLTTQPYAYLPWGPSVPTSIVPPTTGGFQPNQWSGSTSLLTAPSTSASTSAVAAALPDSGVAGVSTGSSLGTVTNTATSATVSPRWTDDQPATVPLCPPFGTDDIWLRIERTAATSKTIRFMYRVGDSGSWTTIKRANGSDAELDLSPWFVQTKALVKTTVSSTSATAFTVYDNSGFQAGDSVQIYNVTAGTSEMCFVTSVIGTTTINLDRAELGTSALSSIPADNAYIIRMTPEYLGPDVQLSVCMQGGPRYWTTLTAAVGSAAVKSIQTWSVRSTSGMQVGDLLQIGNQRERVQINSILSSTSIQVVRGADNVPGSTCNSLLSGEQIASLTNTSANASDLSASNLQIETNLSNTYDVIDKDDWEATDNSAREMSKYLASQYQVLWGIYDITEDFFTYNESSATDRLATEDWFYNPREFWSQSPYWDDARTILKDTTNFTDLTNRLFLGKSTLLTLNMEAVQNYLQNRTLASATVKRITATVADPEPSASSGAALLSSTFNGLFYAARTNRYPWNPLPGSFNPWNQMLPNGSTALYSGSAALVNGEYDNINRALTDSSVLAAYLQPYTTLTYAPAFKPQDFVHGVRIKNASDVFWGYPTSGSAEFGVSKTTICTPNQLFVQGDFNSVAHTVSYKGSTPNKLTPCALMGDMVTLLSNAWNDSNFTIGGLELNAASNYVVSGGGTLAFNQTSSTPLPVATSTSYFGSILTHNQPTTRTSVKYGESAAFINTMVYLEDWSGSDMRFLGSLVVMDSRRYSHSFLLESSKTYGPSPFGYMGSAWNTVYGVSAPDWLGSIGAVQGPPNRKMDFNYDLLTEQGTPPFTPFGVTASGVGSWTRVVE